MLRLLRTVMKDKRGVAALEFVFIAPLMAILLAGIYEVAQLVRVNMKLSSASVSIADLIAQQGDGVTSGTNNVLGNFCKAGLLMMTPFPTVNAGAFSVAMISVTNYSTTGLTVDWESDSSCAATATAVGSAAKTLATSPTNLLPNAGTPGDSVIIVRASYQYNSLIQYLLQDHNADQDCICPAPEQCNDYMHGAVFLRSRMPTPLNPRLMLNPHPSMAGQRGVYGLMFALLLIPLIAIVGCAIDYARIIQYKGDLQNAVDEAALAGASVFTVPTQNTSAITVATNYFNRAILPSALSVSAPTVTANVNGTINPAIGTASAYTVTVSATAKVATTLFSMFIPSVTVSAQGTAGDPIVSPNLVFTNVNSQACDGNTVYLYQVPKNASGNGYDYSSVPAFTVANGTTQGNYFQIGSSYGSLKAAPPGQVMPTFSANQPLGVMLQNDTNGNVGNPACGAQVMGANSYGAPNGGSQNFYSSLIQNKQSPSDNTNYTYTAKITTPQSSSTITGVALTLPANALNPSGSTINYPGTHPLATGSYNTLQTYLGINAPGSSQSKCTITSISTVSNSTTTTYSCQTQYRTSSTSTLPNCSLYIQTGVTQSYINGLTNSSSAPSAAQGQCFSPTGGGSPQYAAPTCSQLSTLASGSGSAATAPAAVFWWDDAGGVGQGEQYYGPSSHCSGASSGGPGYGEDCQYKNNFFAAKCTTSGGSGSGFTEVVLTQ